MLTFNRTLDKMLCATMHLVTLAMMSCFIAFIEKTILVAGISGIHTIRTTGQLIPLTIGIASTLLAARETIMLLLKEVSIRVSHPWPGSK